MPPKPPADPADPNPPPAPPPPPAPAATKCPGCDTPLDKARYCRVCDAKVDDDGDLVPVGLLGRVNALEADADRSGKLTRIFEKGLGIDLDTVNPETFGPVDLVKAAKKKMAESKPEDNDALQKEVLELIPEDLRGLFG